MNEAEVVRYLEAVLSRKLPDWSERDQRGPRTAIITCMDGRLSEYVRPFRFVIRTAGAMAEAVEGSVGLASDATDVTFLATHGDCLAYQGAIAYLATSYAGKVADSDTVRNFNRNDTRPLLSYINTQRRLDRLPASTDQKALAEMAIQYAIQWTVGSRSNKPRVGLFIDLRSVLSARAQPWVVSYDGFSGQQLARFLTGHGMNADLAATHVVAEPHMTGARR
jgi:hypothetical protein